MKINVDNEKYTFVNRDGGFEVDVLRHGQPWMTDIECPKAISTMMAELDAARVVIQAVREHLEIYGHGRDEDSKIMVKELALAMKLHGQLVDDREAPSEWATGPSETDDSKMTIEDLLEEFGNPDDQLPPVPPWHVESHACQYGWITLGAKPEWVLCSCERSSGSMASARARRWPARLFVFLLRRSRASLGARQA